MKKILIVDDDKDMLEIVKALLIDNGFEVKTQTSGLRVSSVLKTFEPNLILMDILLPGKLGTDVCKEIKHKSNVPVVLLSIHGQWMKTYSEYNAVAFIKKPFEPAQLLNTINFHLNQNFIL